MSNVLYRQGCKEVADTLTGVSPAMFGHLLNNLEGALKKRAAQGQSPDHLRGVQETIQRIRPLLPPQATDSTGKEVKENDDQD